MFSQSFNAKFRLLLSLNEAFGVGHGREEVVIPIRHSSKVRHIFTTGMTLM